MNGKQKKRGANPSDSPESLMAGDRSPYLFWLLWIVWLPFLVLPLWDSIRAHPPLPRLAIIISATALFAALYLWGSWRIAQERLSPSPQSPHAATVWWLNTAALIVLSVLLALLGAGNAWLSPFIFTTAYVAGRFPTGRALPVVIALTLLTALVGRFIDPNSFDFMQSVLNVAIAGAVTLSMIRTLRTGQELRAARAEIARLAVTTERLRIARDLHDLLGHNLSLIALKSELARRLVNSTPERAAAEIADIENVARKTLQEVREALAAYRQPTLSNELEGAQEILAAAGVAYHYEGAESIAGKLPPAVEAALAWTLREGITNIIRHSRAQECTIRISRDGGMASIQITDDGMRPPAPHAQPPQSVSSGEGGGSGLRGLAERVQALGGQFEAGPLQGAGFRLSVSVPLVPRGHGEETPGNAASSNKPAGIATTQERWSIRRRGGDKHDSGSAG
jgi:two-component system sensor histidine kinase DesK